MNVSTAIFLTLGILCAVGANLRSEENVTTDETSKVLFDPRAETEMDDFATTNEVAQFAGTLEGDWTLYVEDRSHSIRWNSGLPKRWLADLPGNTGIYTGARKLASFTFFKLAFLPRSPQLLISQLSSATSTAPQAESNQPGFAA